MAQHWGFDGRRCTDGLGCLLLGAALTGCGSSGSGAPSTPAAPATQDAPARQDIPGAQDVSGTPRTPDPEPVATSQCEHELQFVSLGSLPDVESNFGVLPRSGPNWQALDRSSRRLLWSIDQGGGREKSSFRWTKEHGVSELARDALDAMWDPPEQVPYLQVTLSSSDGRVGVGVVGSDAGFRWSDAGEVSRLDLAPQAISRDGTVIGGTKGVQMARWTLAGGVEALGVPAGRPVLMSDAGDVLVSNEDKGSCHRWSVSGGDQQLGLLPGATQCGALLMNATGDVVVGVQQAPPSDRTRVFRWTLLRGMEELEFGNGAVVSAWPYAMSADGSVIAAQVSALDGIQLPFERWTASNGAREIEPETLLFPSFVSPFGDVVMGSIANSVIKEVGEFGYMESFRWTEAGGVERLGVHHQGLALGGKLLVGLGLDGPEILRFGDLGSGSRLIDLLPPDIVPEGWSEPQLGGISEDGGLLVGSALDPSGQRQLWLQHLSCPEP